MSLKIAVKNDLTFDLCNADDRWVDTMVESDPGRHIGSAFGASEWHLEIDPEANEIFVRFAVFAPAYKHADKILPLRPGTIVLGDTLETALRGGTCAVSFRTPEFQAFLDKYGIFAVRRCDLSNKRLRRVDRQEGDDRVMTTCVYSDSVDYGSSANVEEFMFGKVMWVLEKRVRFNAKGDVLEDGYVLFTPIRSLKRLEKSFSEHAILPV